MTFSDMNADHVLCPIRESDLRPTDTSRLPWFLVEVGLTAESEARWQK